MLTAILLSLFPFAAASSGDRDPAFQHCLSRCALADCDPSQPALPFYLRWFGWTCRENCAYACGHVMTDGVGDGSTIHQFYGKWAFHRLGPFQEPFSILMSLGNLYVHLRAIKATRHRIHPSNRLRPWLIALGVVQVNTWVWSTVFHGRDTPRTERLDYLSATLTISFTLLYTLLRIFHILTPVSSTRLLLPMCALIGGIVLGHFAYLSSFPLGSFPYGYHTLFNVVLGLVHNTLWLLWSLSFRMRYPSLTLPSLTLSFPRPYPPNDPYDCPAPREASTPAVLVVLTTLAMSLELWDFAPLFRVFDAHGCWHAATIPLGVAWWRFLLADAIELEGSLKGQRGAGVGLPLEKKWVPAAAHQVE
ncbi:uncharacterized protein L203_103269 [Cryptococcus depauperatus CBS 7841]|uniref:Post-GPI attachment to proteins factor 3 n=1 Tax=Cryptococcus depauperatus CBS 7841 TaxID=1295531 RepID=A0AAJ8JT97_9TREE